MKSKKLNNSRVIHRKLPNSGEKLKYLIVFLHGYGADGADLFNLHNSFSIVKSNAVFISPDAPYECAMSPMGKEWFPLEKIPAGALEASKEFLKFLEKEIEHYSIEHDRVILIGFSQGAMLSLQSLLLSQKKLGGVIAYSGGLKSENFEECKHMIIMGKHINFETPILLVHGKLDEVVPFSSLNLTQNLFENIGFSISSLECSMLGHGIDQEGIEAGKEFLKKI